MQLPQSKRFDYLALLIVAVLLATIILVLQVASGAYHAEFDNDAASHFVSGLMVHDYLLGGLGQSPLNYLKIFHSHYPIVGIGHWPPLYYGIEAVWMVLFGTSLGAMLLLSATGTFLVGIVLCRFLAARFGYISAGIVAAIFCASPVAQQSSHELMLDMPVTLFCLLAMLAYVRYLKDERIRDSVIFAILAFLAIMTKGNGACLALLPPCAVLIGRRFDLLKKPSFWLPLPIVGILTGPWYWLTYQHVAVGFRHTWGFGYLFKSTIENTQAMFASFGFIIVLLSLLGLVKFILRPGRPAEPDFIAAAALFAAVWIFQSLVPAAIQTRYLLPLMPALLFFAVYGLKTILSWQTLLPKSSRVWHSAANVLLVISFLVSSAGLVSKPSSGVIEAVQKILEHTTDGNPVILVSMDAQQEPGAIAALAMHDRQRPNLFAIRGSRLLGGGGYNNFEYLPRFQTTAEVMKAIDQYNIPLMLYRNSRNPNNWEHLEQIETAIVEFPSRFQEIGRVEISETPVLLMSISGNDTKMANTSDLIALSGPSSLTAD